MRENRVYVRVRGPTLTAEAVSRRLGCEPTRAWRPGDRRGDSTLIEADHGWQLDAGLSRRAELDAHLEWARGLLAEHAEGLRAIAQCDATSVVLVITSYTEDEANLSLDLPPELIGLLARAGAGVWLDLYSV